MEGMYQLILHIFSLQMKHGVSLLPLCLNPGNGKGQRRDNCHAPGQKRDAGSHMGAKALGWPNKIHIVGSYSCGQQHTKEG